jgi:hypothetical protein
MSCGRTPHPVRPVILVCAPRVPVETGTHGEPRITTVRISLTVYEKTSLLTVGYGPNLCTAVLLPRLSHAIRYGLIPGSAQTRHRFGDEVWGGGDLLAARRDGCQAEGWGARLDCIPCAPPLGLAGRTRAARRSRPNRTVRRNQRPRSTG